MNGEITRSSRCPAHSGLEVGIAAIQRQIKDLKEEQTRACKKIDQLRTLVWKVALAAAAIGGGGGFAGSHFGG